MFKKILASYFLIIICLVIASLGVPYKTYATNAQSPRITSVNTITGKTIPNGTQVKNLVIQGENLNLVDFCNFVVYDKDGNWFSNCTVPPSGNTIQPLGTEELTISGAPYKIVIDAFGKQNINFSISIIDNGNNTMSAVIPTGGDGGMVGIESGITLENTFNSSFDVIVDRNALKSDLQDFENISVLTANYRFNVGVWGLPSLKGSITAYKDTVYSCSVPSSGSYYVLVVLLDRTNTPLGYYESTVTVTGDASIKPEISEPTQDSSLFGMPNIILYIGSPNTLVNEELKQIDSLDNAVIPVIINGRTMVPVRYISENLGAEVNWTPNEITITNENTTAVLHLDDSKALINGQTVMLDSPPTLINSRTFVPLRFLGENVFKLNVYYENGLIILSQDKNNPDENHRDAHIARLATDITKACELMSKSILNRILKPGMTDLEKEYAIFQYMSNNVVYDDWFNTRPQKHIGNTYGPLVNGIGICGGIANATNLLLKDAGLESYYTVGYDKDAQMEHAWNIVKIGDKYFHLDATQNRFNLNDEQQIKDGKEWDKTAYPKCDGDPTYIIGMGFYVKGDWIYFCDTTDYSTPTFQLYKIKYDGTQKTGICWLDAWLVDGFEDWFYYGRRGKREIHRINLDDTSIVENDFLNTSDFINIPYDKIPQDLLEDYWGEGILNLVVRDGFVYYNKSMNDKNMLYRINIDNKQKQKILEVPLSINNADTGGIGQLQIGLDWITYSIFKDNKVQYYKIRHDGTGNHLFFSGPVN